MRHLLRLISYIAFIMTIAACGGGSNGSVVSSSSTEKTASISTTSPQANENNVATNSFVTVSFSTPILPSSISSDSLIVSDGLRNIPGVVTSLGNSANFRPFTPFTENTTYTVILKKGVKDINGGILSEDRIWSFTTGVNIDSTPPHIFATNPLKSAGVVPVNSSVLITFNEPVDPATVNASTFSVSGPGGPVAGTITTTGINSNFVPTQRFDYLTTYTVTITQGIKDLAGNSLIAAAAYSFKTADVPDVTPPTVVSTLPVSGATGVSASDPISVTFSELISPSTVNTATFVVVGPGGTVTGNVSVLDKVATFTPNSSLTAGAAYTVTLKTGIKDLAGNPLPSVYSWSFTVLGSGSSTNSGLFADYISKSTGSWPEAVAIGDVNGDGRNDVVMVTSYYFDPSNDYKLFVYLQNADGTLAVPVKLDTAGTYTNPPQTVAIGDVNNDGNNEVVVGTNDKIVVFRLDSAGGLVAKKEYATTEALKIKIADLNNDGLLDVVGIGWGTNKANIWYQKAVQDLVDPLNASLTLDVPHDGYDDLEVGDVNGDGLVDIVVMSGQGLVPNVQVLSQKTGGGFNPPVAYSLGGGGLTSGVAVGDVNSDGKIDVITNSEFSASIGVFLQNASGTLNPAVSYAAGNAEPVEIADVNADGRKDVIIANMTSVGVFLQAADGTLKAMETYPAPYATHLNPHGMAVGDINGDGKNDIVIANYNSGLVILLHK